MQYGRNRLPRVLHYSLICDEYLSYPVFDLSVTMENLRS